MADRFLAFDTSTDRLSIAVRHGERTVAHDGPGGAQASATLIPLIRGLLAEAGLSLGDLDGSGQDSSGEGCGEDNGEELHVV